MAVGWARDGAIQDQIDASVGDAVKLARSRLPGGEGLAHCEKCEGVIPIARREATPGLVYASFARQRSKHSRRPSRA